MIVTIRSPRRNPSPLFSLPNVAVTAVAVAAVVVVVVAAVVAAVVVAAAAAAVAAVAVVAAVVTAAAAVWVPEGLAEAEATEVVWVPGYVLSLPHKARS
jgi:hypothetical protein